MITITPFSLKQKSELNQFLDAIKTHGLSGEQQDAMIARLNTFLAFSRPLMRMNRLPQAEQASLFCFESWVDASAPPVIIADLSTLNVDTLDQAYSHYAISTHALQGLVEVQADAISAHFSLMNSPATTQVIGFYSASQLQAYREDLRTSLVNLNRCQFNLLCHLQDLRLNALAISHSR